MKRYMNAALLYAVLAMAGGVFYREFTKFTGFTAKTTLSVIHKMCIRDSHGPGCDDPGGYHRSFKGYPEGIRHGGDHDHP